MNPTPEHKTPRPDKVEIGAAGAAFSMMVALLLIQKTGLALDPATLSQVIEAIGTLALSFIVGRFGLRISRNVGSAHEEAAKHRAQTPETVNAGTAFIETGQGAATGYAEREIRERTGLDVDLDRALGWRDPIEPMEPHPSE